VNDLMVEYSYDVTVCGRDLTVTVGPEV
jgi:hypothetical protein